MDNDLDARESLLRQKRELLDQSLTAYLAYTERIQEINDGISVLKAKDEMDYTALKALQDTKSRLIAESPKKAYLIAELQHEYNIEQKLFFDYLAYRQSNPPELKPSSENSAVQGDTLSYYLLSVQSRFKLLTIIATFPAIMKGLAGFYCHAKNLIRFNHTSEEVTSLLCAKLQDDP